LPKLGWDLAVMNELGKEGFRAHRVDRWVKERDPAATITYEYQRLEAPSTAELAKGMEDMVAEGWGFVCFCPGPDAVVLERPKPGRERASREE
jgi:hypothetical protein